MTIECYVAFRLRHAHLAHPHLFETAERTPAKVTVYSTLTLRLCGVINSLEAHLGVRQF